MIKFNESIDSVDIMCKNVINFDQSFPAHYASSHGSDSNNNQQNGIDTTSNFAQSVPCFISYLGLILPELYLKQFFCQ